MSKKLIAPSILSADFSRLAEAVKLIEQPEGADILHLDIMDGHYVPNLTIGPCVVSSLREKSKLYFESHLMVTNPDDLIDDFAKAGSNRIIVHPETSKHLHRTLSMIKEHNISAGIALNPSTPISEASLEYLGEMIDVILIMSVNPGFGGQKFIKSAIQKTKDLKQELKRLNLLHIQIEIDGGINKETISEASAAGVDIFVAGNAVFKSENPLESVKSLRKMAESSLVSN
jgi:ribulose-phosphate 3-epimerase